MFPNLRAELVRRGMNTKDFAEELGFAYPTLTRKMSGQSDFSYSEIIKIIEYLELTFEYLFKKS